MVYCDGYRSTTLQDEIRIEDIFTIHYFEYTKDFSFDGEKHDFWEMCYVDNGVVEITTDNTHHILFKGDAIFHEPGEFHSLQANGRTAPNLVVLSFACASPAVHWFVGRTLRIREKERSLMGRIIYEAKRTFEPPLDDPLSIGLERKDNQPFGGEQIIRIYLEELLINLIRIDVDIAHPDKRSDVITQGAAETAFGKVVNYLMDNLQHSISTDDICRATGYSRSHLHNVFKDRTGRSVTEYNKRLKLEGAKRMIREGRRNFSEITNALNYSSLQYFSKVFKRYVGMTPSEYASSAKLNSEFVESAEKTTFPGPLGRL